MAYVIITINRAKSVVRSSNANSWGEALRDVEAKRNAAVSANWKTFVNDDAYYEYPSYMSRKNPLYRGRFAMSFSMINGKKEDGGEYYFTYIKKAA